jgi:pimeloyl-ACP methyl ester carboxylesterase
VREVRRRPVTAVLVAAAVAATVGLGTLPAAADTSNPTVYVGAIGDAEYRAEVPVGWNGTLVLWSHAAYRFGFSPTDIELTNNPATRQWLLDHGYAVAASKYQPPSGWVVRQAVDDQMALLDWFSQTVGTPRRTIAEGASMGGLVSTLLAERNPGRFAGVLSVCGDQVGSLATWNLGLDFSFVVKTLVLPDSGVQLVHLDPATAATNAKTAQNLVYGRLADPAAKARLALAGAVGLMPTWSDPLAPEPTDLAGKLAQQSVYYGIQLGFYLGVDRALVEQLAGGNPTWNTGVDYRARLAASDQRQLVEQAYQAAGLDLRADLATLAAAPRVSADPAAVDYQTRYGTPSGTTPAPVVTVHTTGDGLTPPQVQRWYAAQVPHNGDPDQVRQLYVHRGGHCTITASEEIVALQALFQRIDTGHWGDVDPAALTGQADAFGPEYQTVHTAFNRFQPVSPVGFTDYDPGQYPR